jgi:hypothetical protein
VKSRSERGDIFLEEKGREMFSGFGAKINYKWWAIITIFGVKFLLKNDGLHPASTI